MYKNHSSYGRDRSTSFSYMFFNAITHVVLCLTILFVVKFFTQNFTISFHAGAFFEIYRIGGRRTILSIFSSLMVVIMFCDACRVKGY